MGFVFPSNQASYFIDARIWLIFRPSDVSKVDIMCFPEPRLRCAADINRLDLASDVRRNIQLRGLVAGSLIHQHGKGKNLRLP